MLADKRELADIDQFMRDTAARWKNVSMELRCVQSMLEEVVAYWKRWNSLSVEFDAWLDKAERAIHLPEEEKMEFFQDISVWRDNYQLLGDTVSFLIATCEDNVAAELRQHYQIMTNRWDKIYPEVAKYSHAGDILRNRKDFRAGVDMLSTWLRGAEGVLKSPDLGSIEKMKGHSEKLHKLLGEVEGVESLFKNVSKMFQALIQDLSRDEVDKMMNLLKFEKEALVKVRALIPSQINLINQLLVQQQSLESGEKEITQWLDEAEALLSGLTLGGSREQVQDQLEKHRQFFARNLYYRSMLDSKNKVLRSIVKSIDQSKINIAEITAKMDQLNDRFNYVSQNAGIWEQKLQETLRSWHNFNECERVISNWLTNAEKLFAEKHIDSKHTVEVHKNFFEQVNERWIHDLVQGAQDLCRFLPKDQHKPILMSVEKLQSKWRDVLSFAPLHLMRLEFRLDESTFKYYVKEIEKEITSEHIAFSKQENVESIIVRNKEYFVQSGALPETEKTLENLRKTAGVYSQQRPDDKSLQEAYDRMQQQWKEVAVKVENLKEELEQIPEQWNKYHEHFDNISKWMDQVDVTLKNILRDVTTVEEFDREKAVFQVSVSCCIIAREITLDFFVPSAAIANGNCFFFNKAKCLFFNFLCRMSARKLMLNAKT